MGFNYKYIFILFFSIGLLAQNQGLNTVVTTTQAEVKRCSSTEYEAYLQKKHPKRLSKEQFEKWIGPLIEKQKSLRNEIGGVVVIPVVVHVIHNGVNVGIAPNIADEQVRSQITVLNNDYRRILGTPGYNTNPVGADVQIQFALAQVDPKGDPTNGIDRVVYNQDNWSMDDIEMVLKPNTIWDPSSYLNMWSVAFEDTSLLGYAQFPDASGGLEGLDGLGGLGTTDGVVANFGTFGSRTIYPLGTYSGTLYDKGRTMTHEVGHWLGLLHIWGDGGCEVDDFCLDTPNCDGKYFAGVATGGCIAPVQCGNTRQIENYMDYSDDACMNIFTQDQKGRIQTIINNAPRRVSLKASTKDQAIALLNNDAEVKVSFENPNNQFSCNSSSGSSKFITLTNRGNNVLTTAVLNYNIDGGTNQTYNWTGSLATHQSATFSLPLTANNNSTFNISIASVNETVDSRSTNNTASAPVIILQSPVVYPFENVVFNLQQDLWGSEITWSLKDKNNNVLYSGGPYEDTNVMPALITQNWVLSDKECYTFIIEDTQGDGICCAESGDGYYEIKNGSVIIKEGASYGSEDSTFFSIEFENLSQSILFKNNPVHDELKFIVSKSFGREISYQVINLAGKVLYDLPTQVSIETNLNVSGLQTGVYFLRVFSESGAKVFKFIKN